MAEKQDPPQTALVVASERAMKRNAPKKRPVTFAVSRILKRNKFSPLSIMINQIFPTLEPSKQADVLLKLMEYVYTKPRAEDKKRKGPGIQTNVQVNLPTPQQQPEPTKQLEPSKTISLQELLDLASGNKE